MNKTIIAPIIALVLLLVKQLTGFEFTQPEIDVLTDGVLAVTALVGIIINHKKEEPTSRPLG